MVCLACPAGTQGNLCELCDDGYYNPAALSNSAGGTCTRCTCNGNIDENAINNCDTQASTERCLRCVYNTTGDQCEHCLPSYWGNALTSLKCHACECFPPGTMLEDNDDDEDEMHSLVRHIKQCDLANGQCACKANVKNRQCDTCVDGYWNIHSGKGCEDCKCNPLGSYLTFLFFQVYLEHLTILYLNLYIV